MRCDGHRKDGWPCGGQAVSGHTKCRMHGGTNPGRPIVHGRYSKALERHPDVLAAYEMHRADPQLMETLSEIALLRAKLDEFLDSFGSFSSIKTVQAVMTYCDAITRLVERRHKMLYGERVTITVKHFEVLVSQVLAIVKEVYGVDERYTQFLERSERLLSSQADSPGARAR